MSLTVTEQILAEAVKAPQTDTDAPAPVVAVELNGSMYRLTLNMNVLIRVEELTGKGFMQGEIFKMSAKDVRAFVWACVAEDAPNVTLHEVGSWLDMDNIQEIMAVIPELLATWKAEDARMLAPYVPTPMDVIDRALALAKVKPGDKVYDLGAGDGRVMLAAIKLGATTVGCELHDERYDKLMAMLEQLQVTDKAVAVKVPIQSMSLQDADVVFIYLLTTSNTIIAPQLEAQLQVGCRVVTHDFPFNNWSYDIADAVEAEGRTHAIYLYTIGNHLRHLSLASDAVT